MRTKGGCNEPARCLEVVVLGEALGKRALPAQRLAVQDQPYLRNDPHDVLKKKSLHALLEVLLVAHEKMVNISKLSFWLAGGAECIV